MPLLGGISRMLQLNEYYDFLSSNVDVSYYLHAIPMHVREEFKLIYLQVRALTNENFPYK